MQKNLYEGIAIGTGMGVFATLASGITGFAVDAKNFRSGLLAATNLNAAIGITADTCETKLQEADVYQPHPMSETIIDLSGIDGQVQIAQDGGGKLRRASVVFTPASSITVYQVRFITRMIGSLTNANEAMQISLETGAVNPSGTPLGGATGVVYASQYLTADYYLVTARFNAGVDLTGGTQYHITFSYNGTRDAAKYYELATVTCTAPEQRTRIDTAGVWGALAVENVWVQMDYLEFSDMGSDIQDGPIDFTQASKEWNLQAAEFGEIKIDLKGAKRFIRFLNVPSGGTFITLNSFILGDPVIEPHDPSEANFGKLSFNQINSDLEVLT